MTRLEEIYALAHLLASQSKNQERDGYANRERDAENGDAGIDFACSTGHGDCCQYWASARYKNHTHGQADGKPALIAGAGLQLMCPRQELEWPFQ